MERIASAIVFAAIAWAIVTFLNSFKPEGRPTSRGGIITFFVLFALIIAYVKALL